MYNYGEMQRIPMDPKIIEEIQRSPGMLAEQAGHTPGWLSGWGGPGMYQIFARLPVEERLTYAAVLDGNTTVSAIEVATGLTNTQIGMGLSGLQKRGLVSKAEVVSEAGI